MAGHELGHNLGLYHSRNMDCGASPVGTNCTVDEYGDTLDLMGATRGHFNAFQKERLGWLTPSQIVTVNSSGTYALEPLAAPSSGVKALKILKSIDPANGQRTFYYVEQRQGVGYDSFMSGWTNVMTGVAVHTGSESGGNSSYLLDMTPETTSWYDPALTGGRTFSDAAAGLSLTTLSVGSAGSTVSVTLQPTAPTCTPAAPRVTVTQSTTSAVAPGTTVGYSVIVTNNDPAGCNSATFSLVASVPSSWAASLAAPLLSLAPGVTGSTTLSLTADDRPIRFIRSRFVRRMRPPPFTMPAPGPIASSTTPVAPGAPRACRPRSRATPPRSAGSRPPPAVRRPPISSP